MKLYYSASVCDYDEYAAKEFINYISSKDRLKCFETALRCAENAKETSRDIISKAEYIREKATRHYEWSKSEEQFYAKRVSDLQARLKNTNPLRRYPRRGLDGNVMTDNDGNEQYIIEPNSEYITIESDLAETVKKRDDNALEKAVASGTIDQTASLIAKYSLLFEAASQAVERIVDEQKRFVDEMQTIILKTKNAMNAAAHAYDVNIHCRVSARYFNIPYIKKG